MAEVVEKESTAYTNEFLVADMWQGEGEAQHCLFLLQLFSMGSSAGCWKKTCGSGTV